MLFVKCLAKHCINAIIIIIIITVIVVVIIIDRVTINSMTVHLISQCPRQITKTIYNTDKLLICIGGGS